MAAKKAFISYSHDDQAFVRRLVVALNDGGVPSFFDEWDIRPGDSIVAKIFAEGLANSPYFFVVLSNTSVNSSWVKNELDVATVRRIEGVVHVVPILKEDCEIPMSLRALRWLDMRKDFDAGVRELLKLAHGVNDRPPLGNAPDFIRTLSDSIGGLSREASTVGLYLLDRTDLDDGRTPQVGGSEIQTATSLSPQEINDAVEELEGSGLVRTIKWLGTSPFVFGVAMPTYVLFQQFSSRLDYDPEEDSRIVLSAVAALDTCDPATLQSHTGLSVGRLNRAVGNLEDYGLVKVLKYIGTAPYNFGQVQATSQTRRALRATDV